MVTTREFTYGKPGNMQVKKGHDRKNKIEEEENERKETEQTEQ